WLYHIYVCFSEPEPSFPSNPPVTGHLPRVKLYIPPPQRGLRCNMISPHVGMENGIAWITGDVKDTGVILFLQKSRSSPDFWSTINSTADTDEGGKSGHVGENVSNAEPAAIAWPLVHSETGGGLDLVDLRAGVACGPTPADINILGEST
ncbi:6154_t:CDS:2, partial [Acaulospora colombiana]